MCVCVCVREREREREREIALAIAIAYWVDPHFTAVVNNPKGIVVFNIMSAYLCKYSNFIPTRQISFYCITTINVLLVRVVETQSKMQN